MSDLTVVKPETPEFIRGKLKLSQLAGGRNKSTIGGWLDRGCPFTLEEGVHIFETEKVLSWCSIRGIDFYDPSIEPTILQQEKLRQETYKANELGYKEKIREREYAPVAQFEEITVQMLQQIQQLMTETVDSIIKMAKIKGSQAEKVQAKMIEGFNKIADGRQRYETGKEVVKTDDPEPFVKTRAKAGRPPGSKNKVKL